MQPCRSSESESTPSRQIQLKEPRVFSPLRWAGGKERIVVHLVKYLPDDFSLESTRYFEPFLGAGSLFFYLRPRKAFLSDANCDLIQFLERVRDNPGLVARGLQLHAKSNSEKYYYKVRDSFNQRRESAAQAARFLYINLSNFNGIYRVNRQGAFNVPYGNRDVVKWPTSCGLKEVARCLDKAKVSSRDYLTALAKCKSGDFVFLDPPYPPLNKTAFFNHYTKDRFSFMDQEALAGVCNRLNRIGCKFMMTNADTREIRRLYKGFSIHSVNVRRYITCKEKRQARELIITNYEVI